MTRRVCCYAACWRVTLDYGCAAVLAHAKARQFSGPNGEEFTFGGQRSWFDHPTAPAPFVVAIGEYTYGLYDATTDQIAEDRFLGSRYYFWFFGYVAKLPYERGVPPFSPATLSGDPSEASGE